MKPLDSYDPEKPYLLPDLLEPHEFLKELLESDTRAYLGQSNKPQLSDLLEPREITRQFPRKDTKEEEYSVTPNLPKRYWIDHRVGVIAVRDRNVECDSPGLYPSLPGVVYCSHGKRYQGEWGVPQWKVKVARMLCWLLNFVKGNRTNDKRKKVESANDKRIV